ncbi:MAG: nuclear transport factor 2 family protein [Cytophagaceae bacterium]|nr:MAG: nuclear transport factor 2 family protein [Cytophagaceae bacterium]
MKHQELLAARNDWYAAYLAGDTDRMAAFEDISFFVVTESGIQSRAKQLESIDAAVRMKRWFPAGSCSEDRHLELHEVSEGLVSARGAGHIATPQGANPIVLFTELWKNTDHGWQVLHLHYHEAK